MKPTEKLPDLLEFFNGIARIGRLNEVFRLHSRIRYLYEVLCFILIVFDAFFLLITIFFHIRGLQAVAMFDAVVCLFLWVEYLLRVNEQVNKRSFVRYQWTDIVAIIPFDYFAFVSLGVTLPLAVAFKLLRLVRIIALLGFSRRIEREVLAFAELIYGLAIYLLVIIVGATVFFSIESSVNPNVTSIDDALWYIIVTVTSVGFGDIVPYTGYGRIIGVIAMLTAILFASLVTATTTSALLEKFRGERESHRTK